MPDFELEKPRLLPRGQGCKLLPVCRHCFKLRLSHPVLGSGNRSDLLLLTNSLKAQAPQVLCLLAVFLEARALKQELIQAASALSSPQLFLEPLYEFQVL